MSENNNGLNEFNKRQIAIRQRRVRRRSIQRISVLAVFLLLVATIITLFWLMILNIGDKINPNTPPEETKAPLQSGENPDITENPDTPGTVNPPESNEGSGTVAPPQQTVSFETTTKDYLKIEINKGPLLLVNEDHAFIETFTNAENHFENITTLRNSRPTISGKEKDYSLYFMATNVMAEYTVATKLLDMTDACYKDLGFNDLCLSTNGAYRTYAKQEELFNSNATNVKPGCSDFNSGLSVYFVGYPGSSKYPALDDEKYDNGPKLIEWLSKNAYKFGFVKRFTADKSAITGQVEDVGHYRYVGYPHSYVMKEQNLCLEEYIATLAQYKFGQNHLKVTADDGHTYEIYYVPGEGDVTSVTVPSKLPYTVSGDNYSGFIVTVTLD